MVRFIGCNGLLQRWTSGRDSNYLLRWIYYVFLWKKPRSIILLMSLFAICSSFLIVIYTVMLFEYITSRPMQEFGYPLEIDFYKIIEMSNNKDPRLNDIKPINLLPFRYLNLNRNLCDLDSVHLLILVKTTHDQFSSRQTIRNTWAKPDCDDRMRVRTVFLLGQIPKYPYLEKEVNEESRKYKDIVQMDFIDHYYNNTYKLMMGLDFATKYCSDARFIVFVDDDYFVNPWEMVNLVKRVHPLHYPQYVSGFVYFGAIPMRSWLNKWFMSTWEYAFGKFPDYPTAGTMVMSMPLARLIAISAPYTKFHRFDDVFIGLILFKLHIAPVHIRDIYATRPYKMTKSVISSHGFKSCDDLLTVWKNLALDLKCANSIQRRKLKDKLQ